MLNASYQVLDAAEFRFSTWSTWVEWKMDQLWWNSTSCLDMHWEVLERSRNTDLQSNTYFSSSALTLTAVLAVDLPRYAEELPPADHPAGQIVDFAGQLQFHTDTHISRPFSWDQVTWTGTRMNCCRVVDLVKPPRMMPIDALELNCGSRFPKIPFVSECSPEKRSNYVARCLQHFATILSKQKQISLFMADQTYPHQHARRR